MFLPSHLHTCSSSDQKVPAPTGSGSTTLEKTQPQKKQNYWYQLMSHEAYTFIHLNSLNSKNLEITFNKT